MLLLLLRLGWTLTGRARFARAFSCAELVLKLSLCRSLLAKKKCGLGVEGAELTLERWS